MRHLHSEADEALAPESVVSAQWWPHELTQPYEPERELLRAVLLDAVALYRRGRDRMGRSYGHNGEYRDAVAWFASPCRDYVTSFLRICEVLGLEPDWVRRHLDTDQPIGIRPHMVPVRRTIGERTA